MFPTAERNPSQGQWDTIPAFEQSRGLYGPKCFFCCRSEACHANWRFLSISYPRADLAVAYRYLNRGVLTPEEQKEYQPTPSFAEEVRGEDASDANQAEAAANGAQYIEPPGPADVWQKARNRFAPAEPEIHDIRQ